MKRAEDEDAERMEDELTQEEWDPEIASARRSRLAGDFEQYRQAANQLALVGIMTRLHLWIGGFVEGRTKKPSRDPLIKQLKFLNRELGRGPVPLEFFRDLATVRDSIVHAGSTAKWNFGKDRQVAARYQDPWGRVDLSDSQLQEAIDKAVAQVSWYDEKSL
jgi:hypothetical protein